MQFIASAQGYTASAADYIDTSSTLNLQAGDIIVSLVFGDCGSGSLTVADTAGNNSHTVLSRTTAWLRVNMAYRLSAQANSSATIRASCAGVSNWGVLVMQFRPDSGETVEFGDGPASAQSAYGSNPTSAQLSSSGKALWVGGAGSGHSAIGSPQIGGSAVTGSVSRSSSYYGLLGYRVIDTAQTNIAFSSTGDGTWGAQLLYINITESGGSSAYSYYYQMQQ